MLFFFKKERTEKKWESFSSAPPCQPGTRDRSRCKPKWYVLIKLIYCSDNSGKAIKICIFFLSRKPTKNWARSSAMDDNFDFIEVINQPAPAPVAADEFLWAYLRCEGNPLFSQNEEKERVDGRTHERGGKNSDNNKIAGSEIRKSFASSTKTIPANLRYRS